MEIDPGYDQNFVFDLVVRAFYFDFVLREVDFFVWVVIFFSFGGNHLALDHEIEIEENQSDDHDHVFWVGSVATHDHVLYVCHLYFSTKTAKSSFFKT